jgi:hypothetical protein
MEANTIAMHLDQNCAPSGVELVWPMGNAMVVNVAPGAAMNRKQITQTNQ